MAAPQLHHTHRTFMLNMSRAAGKPFETSAKEWCVERLGFSGQKMNCQVCNRALNNYVVLVNRVNSNRIIIGHNCYDKLIHFIKVGRVESMLGDRHSYTGALKKRTAEIVSHTVIGWFRAELDARRITDDDLRHTVSHIEDFGFAPSVEDAQKLVDYYKDHRYVFVEKMVPEVRRWRLRKFIPNHIRIGYVDRLYKLIEQSAAIRRDLVTLRALRVTVRPRLEEMRDEVNGMIEFGHQEPVITEELELIAERIDELLGPCNQRRFARVAITETQELMWWIDQVRPLTWKRIHVRRSASGKFHVKKAGGGFVEVFPGDLMGAEHVVRKGVYEAYYSQYHHKVMVTSVCAT